MYLIHVHGLMMWHGTWDCKLIAFRNLEPISSTPCMCENHDLLTDTQYILVLKIHFSLS